MDDIVLSFVNNLCETPGVFPHGIEAHRFKEVDMTAKAGNFIGIDVAFHLVRNNVEMILIVINILEVIHHDTLDTATGLELWKHMENPFSGQLSFLSMCDLADYLYANAISETFLLEHKDSYVYDTERADFQYQSRKNIQCNQC